MEGRAQTAVEELVRWATPVATGHRVAGHCELDRREITRGDKLVMFIQLGNRDEQAIERPHELDLSRHPNPHVGFGGAALHHCLRQPAQHGCRSRRCSRLLTPLPGDRGREPELSRAASPRRQAACRHAVPQLSLGDLLRGSLPGVDRDPERGSSAWRTAARTAGTGGVGVLTRRRRSRAWR